MQNLLSAEALTAAAFSAEPADLGVPLAVTIPEAVRLLSIGRTTLYK